MRRSSTTTWGTRWSRRQRWIPSCASKLDGLNKSQQAARVGKLVAQRALAQGLKQVVFDRGGYPYHGRVKALADGAREAGLEF